MATSGIGNTDLPLAAGVMTLLTIRGLTDNNNSGGGDAALVPDLWKVIRTGGALSDDVLRRCLTCIFASASTASDCCIAASLVALRKGLQKWNSPPVAVEPPVAEAFRILAREKADLPGFVELAETASSAEKDGRILKTVALHTTLGTALDLYRSHFRDAGGPKRSLKDSLAKYGALELFSLLDELSKVDSGAFQNLLAARSTDKPEESISVLKAKCQDLTRDLEASRKALKRTEDGQKQLHENLKAKTNQASRDHEQRAQERRQHQALLEDLKKQLRDAEEKLLTTQQTNGTLSDQVEKLKAEHKKAAELHHPQPVLRAPAPAPKAVVSLTGPKLNPTDAAPQRDDQFSAFYTYIKKHPAQ
jgi:hypothetical protein